MRASFSAVCVALCALLLVGCTSATIEYRDTDRGGEVKSSPKHATKHSNLKIPPGHLPRPGSCRIWFPGTPPGHQPPAGDCETLAREVPAGAWLLHRTSKKHIDVSVYDEQRPGILLEIRIFDAKNGSFIGIRAESASR